MKKTVYTLFAFFIVTYSFATIRRVNNNPGVVTNSVGPAFVYNNFSAAFTAASATVTDTIYLEPSDISYGFLSISKKIVLIGSGYFLSKNPNTPIDKRTSRVDGISIFSVTTSSSNDMKIYGIEVKAENGNYEDIVITGFGSIEISNCIFNDFKTSTQSNTNCQISNCFIVGSIRSHSATVGLLNSTINNNIILGFVESVDKANIIKNNIIYSGITPNGSIVYNNIIFPGISPTLDFPNESNTYNNVCVGCTGTPTFNNFFTTAANTIFQVAEPRILDDLWDERFKLATASPAKTKGVGGIDCGAFAGPDPYILSGIPPFPMISAFTQGPTSGGNIPITISIKRN